jgi:hypothetical protein
MAATSFAAVPFLIIFVIAQRQIVEGIALSGAKTPVRSYLTAQANEQVKALLQFFSNASIDTSIGSDPAPVGL